ncbi:MAG: lysophospholipid acyltransferase family protein [Acidimicrobiia bacterium]
MTQVEARLAGASLAERAFYRVARSLLVGACRLLLRLRVTGREHVPASGAYLVAPIHRSNVDTPIAAAVTPRRVRFMGKDSLWKVRWLGAVLSALGGFPVTRGTADLEAMRRCLEVLRRGEPLVVFPEGTRQSGPSVHPLFDGAAYLAVKAGVPIIPVGIGGSEHVMPKGSWGVRLRRCHVTIGAPIVPPAVTDRAAVREATAALTRELSLRLQEAFDDARQRAGDRPA